MQQQKEPVAVGWYRHAPKKRVRPTPKTRRLVFERDGHRCRYCGTADRPLEVDHWIPRSLGGGNEMENLRASCGECNREKGVRLPDGPNPYAEQTAAIMAVRVLQGLCPYHNDSSGQVDGWYDRTTGIDRDFTFSGCPTKGCAVLIREYLDGHREWHPGDVLGKYRWERG